MIMGLFSRKKNQDPLNLENTKPKSTLTDTQKELIRKMGAKQRAKKQRESADQSRLREQEDKEEFQQEVQFREKVMEVRRKFDVKMGWRPPDEGDEEED